MAHDHDRRYKQLFSHPLMVRRLIESFVDEPFLSSEEIIAVEPVEKETIAAYIESRESDVLWKVRTRTSELYIYVLIEFQSSVEHDMPFRFLEYVARLYQLWLRVHGGTKVPPIFPVLLYNGDERWTAARSTQAMHETGAMPEQYFPQFSYYPILINEISLESLARIHNAASAVFYVENTDPHGLEQTIQALADILREELPELRKQFSRWLGRYFQSYEVPFDHDEIDRSIAEIQSMFGTKLERYKEELRREGVEEGRQEGETEAALTFARRLLRRGDSVQTVAEITDLPIEKVGALADQIRDEE